MTEQMFEFEAQIPTENSSYTYGWGVRAEGDEGGHWIYVKGITVENEAYEGWRFFNFRDVALFDNQPEKFFGTYRGIREVTQVVREVAWRKDKNPTALRF